MLKDESRSLCMQVKEGNVLWIVWKMIGIKPNKIELGRTQPISIVYFEVSPKRINFVIFCDQHAVHWADSVSVIPSWIRVHFGLVLFYVHFNWIPRYVEWDNCRRWGPAFTLLYFSFHFYMLMFFVSSGVNKFECAWDLRDAFSKRNMMWELHEGQKSHLRSHISSFMTFCGTTIIGREKISRKIFIANHRDFEMPPECLSRWNYTRELNVHWSGLGFYSHVWS